VCQEEGGADLRQDWFGAIMKSESRHAYCLEMQKQTTPTSSPIISQSSQLYDHSSMIPLSSLDDQGSEDSPQGSLHRSMSDIAQKWSSPAMKEVALSSLPLNESPVLEARQVVAMHKDSKRSPSHELEEETLALALCDERGRAYRNVENEDPEVKSEYLAVALMADSAAAASTDCRMPAQISRKDIQLLEKRYDAENIQLQQQWEALQQLETPVERDTVTLPAPVATRRIPSFGKRSTRAPVGS